MWTDELWELGEQLDDPEQWWILKPGMADRGIGIRIFNSKDDLQRIFEEFEQGEEDTNEDNTVSDADATSTAVATSQLRHFVIQEYIQNPLLFDPSETLIPVGGKPLTELHGHKFHLRAYCVAAGALQVYLYERVLALFSAVPYVHPQIGAQQTSQLDLSPHLTNTSLQTYSGEATVRLLDEMVGCQILSGEQSTTFTKEHVTSIADQMAAVLGETFKAALQNPIYFQSLPNAFELYGVDFLVTYTKSSSTPKVNILEVNAEPAIELTGSRLFWILEDLFVSIAKACIEPFFECSYAEKDWAVGEVHHHLIKCLDETVRGPG
ncbi:tubulin-tyrosine ligase/Tubulin polyglutamylase [Crucibulum laeve]|uniref:Tubulin-tyrosine ligase/Tubulin polyglutamylase n=1 Tax=Crucibulum laeve TaxID=68775 RepID=A0A5C3M9A2_9AGAR|nr:tubulin-tyrosine ligase/Tubulin polyglutamylase [Crucibulum laeve]